MALTQVSITPGSGANIEVAAQANGRLRQVVCFGDPDTGEVSPVDPDFGIPVDVKRLADILNDEVVSLNGVTAAGDGSVVPVEGKDFAIIDLRGIDSASITIKGSYTGNSSEYDDLLWLREGTFTMGYNTPDNGIYKVNIHGLKFLKVVVATYGSSLTGGIFARVRALKGNPFQVGFMYRVNPPTFEDRTNGVARVQSKKILSLTGTALVSSSLFGDVDVLAKNAGGNVYSIVGTNLNASVRYLQLFNKATAPANPDVPYNGHSYPLAQYQTLSLGESVFGELGELFPTGIAWGFSTTKDTFTAATTTDHSGTLRYI